MSSSVGVPVLLNCSRSLRFIITGAAHGLGRGLARTLLAAGHDVFIMDSDSGELQYTLQTHLPSVKPASKGRFAGATCDITDPHNVQAALRQAHAFHRDGRCDVLVNNAARADPYWKSIDSLGNAQSSTGSKDALAEGVDPSADAVWQEWRAFVDTNLSGAFLVTRMCLGMLGRGMATEKGPSAAKGSEDDFRPSVIFVSSARAVQSEPNHEGYASTKAGLLGLTHALAGSLAPLGVRSNAILPGWFPSGHESREGDEKYHTWSTDLTELDQSQHWSGRVGRIEDFANTVMFLATTRFANGEQVVLDGGMSRKMQYEE